jgi:DNA primase
MARVVEAADVERVREATDLLDLASEHTSLRLVGRAYYGRCPFHSETKTSFVINPNLHRFVCFGCGVRGDAIEYVCQVEHIDHDEAVERLAVRAGITLRCEDR